jgi:hypothetical protein
MTTICAAMSEITRVAWWSLRALGCPLGAVERMAKVLAISEVVEGGSLEALKHDELRLIESFKADEPRFERKNARYGVVDACGRTFLDIGPRAVDLLTGIAKTSGTARIRVRGASDLLGLSGTCTLAANRGIPVLSIATENRASGQFKWMLYLNTPSGIQTISGSAADGQRAIIETLHRAGIVHASLTELPEAEEEDELGKDRFALDLVGFAPSETREFHSNSDAAIRANAQLQWADVGAALHDAYANGIDVEESNLKFLYELETRTWAPSSERSRMQAGFGAPTPAPASS